MNHLGTKTLETKRLRLRRFEIDDAQAMFDNWASNEEVTKYLTWPAHQSITVSQEYIKSLISRYEKLNTYEWGIELKEIRQVIGSLGVVRCNDEVGYVHVGYCIGKQWWSKGITSEAFSAVIKYLMDEVKVNRIEARHDPRNFVSGKVMEKCGLKYEGTLRESDINNQGRCDAAWYSLLKTDYHL
ncbi:MAG TPA: GNAT family N-acetyltransferase [Oscillospiraceae bacterium]|nr:GNAT family N-acetyltransferase [Oscillospiraceae bacterium]